MTKIAYVGLGCHRATQSEEFLTSLLERSGCAVDRFWDDSWGKNFAPLSKFKEYSVIIMHQTLCTSPRPYASYNKNIIFIPMLDSHVRNHSNYLDDLYSAMQFWQTLGGVKIISFSSTLHNFFTEIGICSKYFQNFPPPQTHQKNIPGLHGFFWLRRGDLIPWQTIKTLLGNTHFDSMHIHLAPDFRAAPIQLSECDIKKYNITFSSWFEKRDDYEALLSTKNVFFAPRPVEGIGFSFLEAMSRGQCVVAPNFPTMSEYITHGENGLLYDIHNPMKLDFSDINEIGKRAYDSVVSGYEKWKQSEREIVDFILLPTEEAYHAIGEKNLKPAMSLKRSIEMLDAIQEIIYWLKKIKMTIKAILR